MTPPTHIARAIASALGDDLDHAFETRRDWMDAGGIASGRYRKLNEPLRPEYICAAEAALAVTLEWQPIETAPKDLTPILLRFKERIKVESDYRWDGLCFVGIHPGVEPDGFDIGWSFAAPVGMGGFPDKWFAGWMPIPAPPVRETKTDGV